MNLRYDRGNLRKQVEAVLRGFDSSIAGISVKARRRRRRP
jgi:hypothetical protein